MSEFVKINYGATDGSIRPESLQELGRPASITMQGLSPNIQYYAQAELYDGLQLVSQSLQETFRTLSAGVITLTHVSDIRSGSNYTINYIVSSTYALSSSVMSINGTNVQGQISGNTISFVVSGLTMGNVYPYNISTIDIYAESDTTSNSLTTIAQNYITIEYASRTSSSVTFDLDYVSDGGFYQGFLECWLSTDNPETDQPYAHVFFQDGEDTVTQTNLEEETEYKFRATIIQSVGGTEIYSSVVTQSTEAHDYSEDYLTITSTSASNQVKLKSNTSWSSATIDFSTDGGNTWTSVAASSSGLGNAVATLNNGDKLIMRHTGSIGNGNTQIYCSGSYTVSGNLASLQFGDNFNVSGQTAQEFGSLFNNTPVTSAKDLYLGAYSTMGTYSFRYMFQNCRSLTTAPTLPATTMAEDCYSHMFENCTSLTTAPTLPTTTLAQGCYSHMFAGCTSLTTAPTLPATTLVRSCYASMFAGCTSLTSAPALQATTLELGCYEGMFRGCTSLTTAPTLSSTTLAQSCYYQMFQGCTSLTTAPDLRHVTSIGTNAMNYMFSGCTSLSVAYAPTPSSWETAKMRDWLYGVANSGTLFADPSIASSIPTNSSSGCPSGWSVGAVSDEFFNYFTIKNESENTNTISLWAESYLAERDVDISVDGGKTWTAYTALRNPGQPVAQLSAGGEMLARYVGTIGDPHYISFRSSDKISAHGNVASLQFGDNFKKIKQTISATQFNGLFIGSEYLIDASKLSFESYTATQGLGLYRSFERCTSLIDPPDFSRITSVNNDRSFFQTFYGCSSLTKVYAPSPSVWHSGNTYQNWLYGVAASGTIYTNPTTAASIPTNSTSGCPTGWSISTT